MSNNWNKTKTLPERFESIAEVRTPYSHNASEFYSMVSKYVHNDTLEIYKMNTSKNKDLYFLVLRAFYFSAMVRYNPMLREEYRKRYGETPSICKDIDYQSSKAFM